MASVSFSDSYSVSYWGSITAKVRVTFNESFNDATNKTTLTLTKLEFKKNGSSNVGDIPVYGVLSVNGTTVCTIDNSGSGKKSSVNMDGDGWRSASLSNVTKTPVVVTHNADGTKSVSVSVAPGTNSRFCAQYAWYHQWSTTPDGHPLYRTTYVPFGVPTSSATMALTTHTPTYTVSYNANGGTGAPASQTKTYDVPLTLTTTKPSKATTTDATYTVTYNYHNGSSNTTATATKKTAYTFSKWNTQSDGTGTNYSSGGTYSANRSDTLYAQYTPSTSTTSVTLPTPTRTGYSFKGWYTEETGGTKIDNGGASYTPTAAITLHAQWTALASTIATRSSSVATQSNFTLTVTRMSSAYYHRATFKIDGTEMDTSSAFATSLSYTIPRSWFTSYSDKTFKAVDVYVQTYTTSACTTTVGSPATTSFTMTADSGMKPTVSSGWATFAYDNTDTAAENIAGYVKGYSKAQVTFKQSKITLDDSPGATIASYSVTCLGSTDSSSPYHTPTLTSTSVTATCKVTDSRGRSASQNFTISVMDYAKPSISGVAVFRCNAGGTADEDGTYISVKATRSFSSLNSLNSCTLTAQIAPSGGSYGAATPLTSGTASKLGGGALSADTSYTVKIVAQDSLSNSATYYYTVPTRKWAMKFRTDGSGVAFGKAAEADNVFDVNPSWTVKHGPLAASGNIVVSKSGDTYVEAVNSDTGCRIEIDSTTGGASGVWSSGYNDGTYHASSKWLVRRKTDGSVEVDGDCTGNAANVTGTVAVANGGTGATTAAAARANLGLGEIRFFQTATPANGSITITFPASSCMGAILTSGAGSAKRSMYLFGSTSAGYVGATRVFAGADVSVAESGTQLTISNTASGYLFVNIMQWAGTSVTIS